MRTFWGDLHAHCAVSYGFGTAERALANAAAHLDFCSITGHAFWPDMPTDLERNDATMLKHLGGFAKLRHFWPALLNAAATAERPGGFVALPSYEWHSMRYGDHNCYAAGPELPLIDADTPAGLEAALRAAGVDPLVLPHHIGYAAGWRGIDWTVFDAQRSPVLEIFSSHGASEADDAPYPYDENMGFRHGPSTARAGLVAGHRFGFQAGTDSHDGYPGHYGHGRVGVLADRLGRAEVFEALRARRTIASTGPRVGVEFELEGAGIGQAARRRDRMRLHLRLRACDTLVRVELIEGDRDGWRVRALPLPPVTSRFVAGRHLVRVEAGWGRHGTISDWNLLARVRRGSLVAATPYFRYAGHGNDEPAASETVLEVGDAHVAWRCRARAVPSGATSGGTHHAAGGPQTMLLEIDGDETTELQVNGDSIELTASLPELASGSRGRFVDGLASPALVMQRAAPEREWTALHDLTITPPAAGGFVYLRVMQADGQAAWASPVFLD